MSSTKADTESWRYSPGQKSVPGSWRQESTRTHAGSEANMQWNRNQWHKTQFQIEGGGMVQGVTKLIMTFSTFFDPKT